jgi:glycosyltransferase involved in cell wall biosynthesis
MVSVVIPCKNAAADIEAAVESVLAQDYPEISCIVVDGGSTDRTFEILERFGKDITLLSEPDSGPYEALNKGFSLAQGAILAWLGVKDRWLRGSAAAAAQFLTTHPDVDVVYGCFGIARPDGTLDKILPALQWDLRKVVVEARDLINPGTAFFRRSVFERAGPFRNDASYIDDFWLRVALEGSRYCSVPMLMAYSFRSNEKRPDAPSRTQARIDLTRRVFEHETLPEPIRRQQRKALSNAYIKSILSLDVHKPGHWPAGLRLFMAALRTDASNTRDSLAELSRPIAWHFSQAMIGPRQAFRRTVRLLTAPLRWRPRLHVRVPNLVGVAAPILVLGGIAASAATIFYPEVLTEEAIRRVGQIATPVALLAIWLELRRRC